MKVVWLTVAAVALAACTDDGTGTKTDDAPPSPGVGMPEPVPPAKDPDAVIAGTPPSCVTGPGPLQKLSSLQLGNAVRDLLKASNASFALADVDAALFALPPDVREGNFPETDDRISLNHVAAFYAVAVALADSIVATPSHLQSVLGECAIKGLPAACVGDFIKRFGRRAFRRPLTAIERSSMEELTAAASTPTEGVRNVIVKLLMAPEFLYHMEVGGAAYAKDANMLRLTSFEVASRLAFLFWRSAPDDALLDAAENGSLDTERGFIEQVDRVFSDKRTQDTLWSFYKHWFRLDDFLGFQLRSRFLNSFAKGLGFDDANKRHHGQMVDEIRALTDLVTWQSRGGIRELLLNNEVVTSSSFLAELYGMPAWNGKTERPRFPASQRAGLLTRAALLVTGDERTSPIHRGGFIRRSILCDNIPDPDPNALPPGSLVPPVPAAGSTTRERFTQKTADAACTACHSFFNDIGYIMEAYDGLGRARSKEIVYNADNGQPVDELPIDTVATPRIKDDDTTKVSGPVELSNVIADSGKVQACFSRQLFRFSQRRNEDSTQEKDTCLIDAVTSVLNTKGGTLADAFKQVALAPSFRVRRMPGK